MRPGAAVTSPSLFGPCYSARVSATLPPVEEGKSKIYKHAPSGDTRSSPNDEEAHNTETPHPPSRGPPPS